MSLFVVVSFKKAFNIEVFTFIFVCIPFNTIQNAILKTSVCEKRQKYKKVMEEVNIDDKTVLLHQSY